MFLPNKITTYKESVLALFPPLLHRIKEQPWSPSELYHIFQKKGTSLPLFIHAVECLYALGKVDIDIENEVILYVD